MLTARNEPGPSFTHGRSQVSPTRKESGLAVTRLGIAKSAGLPVNFQIACHPLAEGLAASFVASSCRFQVALQRS